jgi:hypothetical protein
LSGSSRGQKKGFIIVDRIYRVKFRVKTLFVDILVDYIVRALVRAGFDCLSLNACIIRVHNHTPAKETMLMLKISNEDWWLEPVGWVESGKGFGTVRMEDEYHG